MRLRDENKRRAIMQTAVKLFSERPFDQVRLEEVAAAAGVGKGTVYIYFKSKEELYYGLVYDGFADLVRDLEQKLGQGSVLFADKVRVIVSALIEFSNRHPQLIEVMRATGVPDANSAWEAKRRDLARLIEGVIRQGVAVGELVDSQPQMTALYFMGMVRAVMLYGSPEVQGEAAVEHVSGFILRGIGKGV
jgi:AcrR family transcriptional regulator